MAGYFRLQDLITVAQTTKQDVKDAVDVGAYGTLVIQVRKLAFAASGASLVIEHSATLVESSFHALGSPFSLSATDPETIVFTNPLRYIRWSSTFGTGSATFTIDVVGRA